MLIMLLSPLLIAAQDSTFLSRDDMSFLESITAAVVAESRVYPDAKVGAIGPNATGDVLIRPGGRDCYPAFWIRDYAMSLESGFITPKEQLHALTLTAEKQQKDPWNLKSGSFVPPGAIADHISFGGAPIFYPGTLEDYEGQGGPNWGKLPALDDHYFFIHMAAEYVHSTNEQGILKELINEESLINRLEKAFQVPPSRSDTELSHATDNDRGVTFGFVDSIAHTGDLLFCSLLKFRAANELAEMKMLLNDEAGAKKYKEIAIKIREAIPKTFGNENGFLKASTEKSSQSDVWGTAFAVYIGALDGECEKAACKALAKAYDEGTIVWRGNIRHVPTNADFNETTAWEAALTPKNRYQNGAYWGTPTGWVCYAIAKVDLGAARKLAAEYIAELREGDFRKGPEFGSPWECMHPDGAHRQNPVYMTSVTCPLAAYKRIEKELKNGQIRMQ